MTFLHLPQLLRERECVSLRPALVASAQRTVWSLFKKIRAFCIFSTASNIYMKFANRNSHPERTSASLHSQLTGEGVSEL